MNEEKDKFKFTADVQRKIIAMLIKNEKALKENIALVRPEYFTNPVHNSIVKLLTEFYRKLQEI